MKDAPPAPATFAAPERRGDRALDRGCAHCRATARRDPAHARKSHWRRACPCPASDLGRPPRWPPGEALHAAARADRTAAQARTVTRTRRDRRGARSARADPGRGASGFARLPAPFAGARREAGHHCHGQGRRPGRAWPVAPRARRPQTSHSPLAARARPALRSCSASRKPAAPTVAPARSMCG